MARIQVLPLTTVTLGSASSTPYVIVFDQLDEERDEVGNPIWTQETIDRLTSELGARTVLVIDGTLDVGNVDQELHAAAQAAVLREFDSERTPAGPSKG